MVIVLGFYQPKSHPGDFHCDSCIGLQSRLNGKVERSHRSDEEEYCRMLKGDVIDDTRLFNEKHKEWEDLYNYQRPHSALSGMTPYERFRESDGFQV